jgi:ATP-binding protein involved in chromosome partitioning
VTSGPDPEPQAKLGSLASPARFIVAVAAGKGGVGKSTISLNLALALGEKGRQVGLLDADFYGPDIPLMVGWKKTKPLTRWALWRHQELEELRLQPVTRYGLKIMSVGLLLGEQQALAWPAQMIEFVGRQFITEVDWGELDYLVIDFPPGTGDIQQQLVSLLPIMAAVVVVTPQDVAHVDAKRVLELFRDKGIRVLGAIENMGALDCPHCGGHIDLFPSVRGDRSIWAHGAQRLDAVPLDLAIARGGDSGRPIFISRPKGGATLAFRNLATTVIAELEGVPPPPKLR